MRAEGGSRSRDEFVRQRLICRFAPRRECGELALLLEAVKSQLTMATSSADF